MSRMKRRPVNKARSAQRFRKQSRRTNRRNMTGVMRGGIRL